jgi:hypothetical protein
VRRSGLQKRQWRPRRVRRALHLNAAVDELQASLPARRQSPARRTASRSARTAPRRTGQLLTEAHPRACPRTAARRPAAGARRAGRAQASRVSQGLDRRPRASDARTPGASSGPPLRQREEQVARRWLGKARRLGEECRSGRRAARRAARSCGPRRRGLTRKARARSAREPPSASQATKRGVGLAGRPGLVGLKPALVDAQRGRQRAQALERARLRRSPRRIEYCSPEKARSDSSRGVASAWLAIACPITASLRAAAPAARARSSLVGCREARRTSTFSSSARSSFWRLAPGRTPIGREAAGIELGRGELEARARGKIMYVRTIDFGNLDWTARPHRSRRRLPSRSSVPQRDDRAGPAGTQRDGDAAGRWGYRLPPCKSPDARSGRRAQADRARRPVAAAAASGSAPRPAASPLVAL